MQWQPSKYLEDPQEYQRKYVTNKKDMASHHGKFALIILNQPILIHRTLFNNIWENGKSARNEAGRESPRRDFRVCVCV
jgi:hypothetical protein